MSSQIKTKILFAEKIRHLREDRQLLQRQLSAALEIDNALYCKIERGDRSAKREQVVKLAEIFHVDPKELLVLWLADKVTAIIEEDKEMSDEVLDVVRKELKK